MGLGRGGGLLNRWVKEVTVKTPPVELTHVWPFVCGCRQLLAGYGGFGGKQ